MLIRTTKITLEIAAAIFAGVVVLAALVFWRASTQPVPLEFLKSRVAEALIPAERGTASQTIRQHLRAGKVRIALHHSKKTTEHRNHPTDKSMEAPTPREPDNPELQNRTNYGTQTMPHTHPIASSRRTAETRTTEPPKYSQSPRKTTHGPLDPTQLENKNHIDTTHPS